ncbi:Golgi to ER traffic- protein [Puccinia graminis f. sp. tritici]|uniref:Golgi to ER traffic-protein n=1 Tax=Puccinia graminis f. sp. tritici TaxID=56615 RepID=A0A5B0PPI2_PUCGR|nr:Golgi to ER traffic- protein [Puccinia graminis f. sp. tritici]
MVQWSSSDMECDKFYEKPELFTPSVEAIQAFGVAHDPDFRHILTSNPRLLQLDARDPFFRPKVFNVELVKQAATSNKSFRCASWKSLCSMMIRVDNQEDFTEDTDIHPGIQSAIRKLHSLTKLCVDNLHLYLNPNPVGQADLIHWKQDTMFEAGRFVIGKIKSLQAGADTTTNTNGNGRTANGLLVLQKRIWETLLCCLMMQNSYFIDYLEECIKKNHFPDKSLEAAAKMSQYNRERSLFKEGDVKDLNSTKEMKEWGKIRLSAFGSMAVFFLFGAAGWWHCLPDSHNFNQRDVWSFVHLAHAKHEWLYDQDQITTRPEDNTPWDKTDSFVRWLLRKTNMNCLLPSNVDWEAAPRFWAKHLTAKTITRFVIQDIVAEICVEQPNKTLNYKGEEAPDVKLHPTFQEKAKLMKSTLMGSWPDTIEAHKQNVREAKEDSKREGSAMLLDRPSQTPPLGQKLPTKFPSPSGHSAYSLLHKAKKSEKMTTDSLDDKDSNSEPKENDKEESAEEEGSEEEAEEEKESGDESEEEEEEQGSRASQVPPTKTGKPQSSEGSSSLSEPPSEDKPESSGTDPHREPSE